MLKGKKVDKDRQSGMFWFCFLRHRTMSPNVS